MTRSALPVELVRSSGNYWWLAAMICLLMCGCRSWPWRHGPVPDSVTTCRDFSHQALVEIEQGNLETAEALLLEAVKACPTDSDARKYYAEVLVRNGKIEEALSHCEQARRLAPHDGTLCVRAGEMYLTNGDTEKADRRANLALSNDRNSPEAWILRGKVKLARGESEQALADFQRALGHRPGDIQLSRQIAELYLAMHHPDRALMHFQNLAQHIPLADQPQDLLELQAQTFEMLGRLPDALNCYRLAGNLQPESAELFYRLARLEFAVGSAANARLAAEAALRLQPAHVASQHLLQQIASGPPAAGQPIQRAGGIAPQRF